jgi:hypothetical protein
MNWRTTGFTSVYIAFFYSYSGLNTIFYDRKLESKRNYILLYLIK